MLPVMLVVYLPTDPSVMINGQQLLGNGNDFVNQRYTYPQVLLDTAQLICLWENNLNNSSYMPRSENVRSIDEHAKLNKKLYNDYRQFHFCDTS